MTSNTVTLKRDLTDILKLHKYGGSVMFRDDETILITSMAQVCHHDMTLLLSIHPYLHITYQSQYSISGEDGFVIHITILPYTTMIMSMHAFELFVAGMMFFSSMFVMILYTQI